jgi:hypothetical protein
VCNRKRWRRTVASFPPLNESAQWEASQFRRAPSIKSREAWIFKCKWSLKPAMLARGDGMPADTARRPIRCEPKLKIRRECCMLTKQLAKLSWLAKLVGWHKIYKKGCLRHRVSVHPTPLASRLHLLLQHKLHVPWCSSAPPPTPQPVSSCHSGTSSSLSHGLARRASLRSTASSATTAAASNLNSSAWRRGEGGGCARRGPRLGTVCPSPAFVQAGWT